MTTDVTWFVTENELIQGYFIATQPEGFDRNDLPELGRFETRETAEYVVRLHNETLLRETAKAPKQFRRFRRIWRRAWWTIAFAWFSLYGVANWAVEPTTGHAFSAAAFILCAASILWNWSRKEKYSDFWMDSSAFWYNRCDYWQTQNAYWMERNEGWYKLVNKLNDQLARRKPSWATTPTSPTPSISHSESTSQAPEA